MPKTVKRQDKSGSGDLHNDEGSLAGLGKKPIKHVQSGKEKKTSKGAVYTTFVAPSRPKNESVTDQPTDRPTDQRTDTRSYRVAASRLKSHFLLRTPGLKKCTNRTNLCNFLFSRDEATLYERVSVRPSIGWSVRPSVTLSLFGLLGATNAVYTAPLLVF